ncbi:hypothetical protein [Parvicella tangerina]|uniref:Outer membrane protein beta-barrel domain-containing protein n=1 Tax=Parvicella tangerina TaxID=2829795 RepID=A0A916NDC9_9FLAO|nr:hypothetical protein [Parvicella tangerina]CAG5085167.1 hypothetical protein CRYO30217_02667 [Parvicella tangerina]
MRKIVKITAIILGIIGFHSVQAQTITAKNTVYAELLGKGFYYSINYERNIYELNEKISFQGSIGLCLVSGQYTDRYKELIDGMSMDFTLPLELNVRYSMGNHNIVAGYGTTYWRYYLPDIEINSSNIDQQPVDPTMKKVKEWFAHAVVEYRWQKPEGGLMAKAGWSPLFFAKMENFRYQKKVNFANSFNIGVGYSF